MAELVLKEVDEWKSKHAGFDLSQRAPTFALRVMTEMLLGQEFAEKNIAELSAQYHIYCKGLFVPAINLPFTRFGKAMKARAMLNAMFLAEILVHRRLLEDDYVNHPSKKKT
eukprot:CAMPEP_0184023592 /NCGR_PEP_ID=MMETSP0954-20121128/11472_1 /TAXON_ID=627963 /ORGANISM="Aplanochytrium sp, Strain PBS07" /LENGTH=111 /DNA_ID=CAMNT_0026306545 /DNA_START=67 /DNA_END=398 /DNA_ORIENTATION=-